MESVKDYTDKWDMRWKKQHTPWDNGEAALALVDLFQQNQFPTSGEAFVPGCGTGYDVTFIATWKDWKATGLDISETAVEVALKRRNELGISPERCQFVMSDFFTFKGSFDLVFDHTFLCALQPIQRPQWASKMAEIVKPGGFLVAYMFPIGTHTDGPPFAVSVELYESLLSPYFKAKLIKDIDRTFERRLQGPHKEKISVWIRQDN